MPIRILLVDDHEMFRDGLESLVGKEEKMQVVGVAENGRVAVKKVSELSPDIVVMDVSMPDLNGIEATRQIKYGGSHVKIIALSVHSSKQFVTGMLAAGASGYLLKANAFEELINAINAVQSGQTYLTPRIAGVVVDGYVQYVNTETDTGDMVLSPREREVLQLLAEGNANKKIADLLSISIKTVDTHRQNLMQKLGLRTLPELTKYAIREGLTSLEG